VDVVVKGMIVKEPLANVFLNLLFTEYEEEDEEDNSNKANNKVGVRSCFTAS